MPVFNPAQVNIAKTPNILKGDGNGGAVAGPSATDPTFNSVTASWLLSAQFAPPTDTSGGTGVFLSPGFVRFRAGQGSSTAQFQSGKFELGASIVTFASGDPSGTAPDVSLFRTAAGTLALGMAGNAIGSLALGKLTASGPSKFGVYTVSGLPSNSGGAYNGYTATVSNPAAGKSSLVTGNSSNWLYQDGSIAA